MSRSGARWPSRQPLEWLILLLAFVAVGGLLGAALLLECDRIVGVEQDRLRAQARILDENLERHLRSVNSALEGVADDLAEAPLSGEGGVSARRLQRLEAMLSGTGQWLLATPAGHVLATSQSESWNTVDLRPGILERIRQVPNSDRLYLSDPYRASSGHVRMQLARSVVHPRRGMLGVVAVSLDAQFFDVILKSVLYAPDMAVQLRTRAGEPVLRFGAESEGRTTPALQVTVALHDALLAMDGGLEIQLQRDADVVVQGWRRQFAAFSAVYLVLLAVSAGGLWAWKRRRRFIERVRAEREAQRKAHIERLEFTLTGVDVGLWDWNLKSNQVVLTARQFDMLGEPHGALQRDAGWWLERLHPEDVAVRQGLLVQHLKRLAPAYEAEYRVRHAQGHWVWILDRGKVLERSPSGLARRMVGAHTDITARKQAHEALRHSEVRLRNLHELSSDWFWETGADLRFTRFEGHVHMIWPGSVESILGKTRWELGALNMGEDDWAAHRALLLNRQPFRNLELQRLDPQGQLSWIEVSGMPVFDENRHFVGYRGVGRNITERKRVEAQIEHLAFFDALTGLPNRRLLLDRLEQALARARAGGQRGALLFIDLDNFKDLNDTMGHDLGDDLLVQVARRLQHSVGEQGTVGRLGGDEFVVLMEALEGDEPQAQDTARALADAVLECLNQPFDLQTYQHHGTPSIGVALFDGAALTVEEMLKRADLAMYQAKALGRNTACFFRPEMQQVLIQRSLLESELRAALARQELVLYYQPVVGQQGRLLGAEALVRWPHAQRGMVSPADFIPLAEQSGLILPLGQWVLRTACEQLRCWQAEPATAELSIAVNVSARQFRHPDFVAQVLEVLAQTGVDPRGLKLELTESLLLNDVEDIIDRMSALKAQGVGFSLDDFGTGYSSLSYLKRLPLDQLKIDQSFVRDVLTDPNDAAIVRTILALARSLDLDAVAEGVETPGQLAFLEGCGCGAFQGYLLGRPAPMAQMRAAWVARQEACLADALS